MATAKFARNRVFESPVRSMASIVVTNVDMNITEMNLRELFSTMGPIVSVQSLG